MSDVSPVLGAVLAWYVIGERLNRWQWSALALALAGAFTAIRPAFGKAGAAFVFPLLMAISYAAYQVLTR